MLSVPPPLTVKVATSVSAFPVNVLEPLRLIVPVPDTTRLPLLTLLPAPYMLPAIVSVFGLLLAR